MTTAHAALVRDLPLSREKRRAYLAFVLRMSCFFAPAYVAAARNWLAQMEEKSHVSSQP